MKTVELTPVPLGLLRQLEHHHQRRRSGAAAFRLTGPMPHCRKGRFDRIRRPQMHPVLGREIIEREQHNFVFSQALGRLRILCGKLRKESTIGDERSFFCRRQIHLFNQLLGIRLNALG